MAIQSDSKLAKSWRTFRPADDEVVLAYSLLNEYLVSTTKFVHELKSRGCWFVYREDQTVPQKSANKDEVKTNSASQKQQKKARRKKTTELHQTSSQTNSTSSYLLPPYDVGSIANNDAKASSEQDLRQQQNETRLITRQPESKGVHVYFPEGFPWERHPDLNRHRSTVLWLGHKLHERRFVNAEGEIYDKDAFITTRRWKQAKTLQAAEADLIIGNVCGRLRREGRVKFLTPVHDSVLFLPKDGDYIKAVMEGEFAKLVLKPRLEPKDLEA